MDHWNHFLNHERAEGRFSQTETVFYPHKADGKRIALDQKSKNDETLFPRLNLIHLASDKGGKLKENVYRWVYELQTIFIFRVVGITDKYLHFVSDSSGCKFSYFPA